MKPTVYLDIETTGLDPVKHQILEVAMIFDGAPATRLRSVDEVHFSLAIDPVRASQAALRINRYDERQGELRTRELLPHVAAYTLIRALADRVVVGNNVQFDMRFIENFLRQQGADDPTPWNYHLIDVKALAAGRFQMGPAPWKTEAVAAAAGVPLSDDAHTAMADAQWNKAVYEEVTA